MSSSSADAAAGGTALDLVIRADTGDVDQWRYNLPTAAGEVAALLPGEPVAGPRDIVIQTTDGQLQRISESNAAYEPLHFPLMVPAGDAGWHLGIKHVTPATKPALVAAQQQQYEQFPEVEQRLQEEEQQPRSAAQIALQIMQQLRELQPSQQPEQEDGPLGARSDSDDDLDDGRARENR